MNHTAAWLTLAGLGLLWMFLGTPMFRPLYGSIFLLVIATIMSGVTLSTQIFKGALLNLGKELEDATLDEMERVWQQAKASGL